MHSILTGILIWIFWVSVFVIVYSYFIYPVLLHLLVWCFGKPPASSASYLPTVAIVIPVCNEEKVIGEKIRNILGLDYPPEKLSIWIGSDCSTDRTEEIVRSHTDPRIHLWIARRRSGKAGILNELVPQVDAEIVVFTDADIMIEADGIRTLVRHFADERVGGVGGVTRHRGGEDSDLSEEAAYRSFEAMQKRLESMLHSTISAFGPFYAIRSTLFVKYHPHTYSNDDVIMPMNIIRQGYRMFFDAEAVSYEEGVGDVKIELKRRIRISAGNFQAFFWLLDFLNPLRGWPWFCYVSHKVTRWFSPIFLFSTAAACMGLALYHGAAFYKIVFITSLIFVGSGLFHKIIPLPITRHVFYFLAMNVAMVLGFFKFLRGIRSAAWVRTER